MSQDASPSFSSSSSTPDILRQPTADVLTKFAAGDTPLIAVWYALTVSAVVLVPLAVLVHRVLAERETATVLCSATAFGVVAGLGPDAWVPALTILVPHLAQSYLAAGASEAQRAAAARTAQHTGLNGHVSSAAEGEGIADVLQVLGSAVDASRLSKRGARSQQRRSSHS